MLLSCAELLVKAETKENEAKEMEKEASQKLVSTLPRQFGQALSSRLGKGDKESVRSCCVTWIRMATGRCRTSSYGR